MVLAQVTMGGLAWKGLKEEVEVAEMHAWHWSAGLNAPSGTQVLSMKQEPGFSVAAGQAPVEVSQEPMLWQASVVHVVVATGFPQTPWALQVSPEVQALASEQDAPSVTLYPVVEIEGTQAWHWLSGSTAPASMQ
jgi:hypothetical protein